MTPLQVLSILWRRGWIVVLTFASTMAGAGGFMWLVPPRYDAVATASIDPAQTDPVTGLAIGGPNIRLLQGNLVALVKSHRVAIAVAKRLNLMANPGLVARYRTSAAAGQVDVTDWIADDLLQRVDARFLEPSNVLEIKYKSDSAISAARIVNTFLSTFVDAAVEMKVGSAQQTAQWFQPQTEKLRADLVVANQKFAKFQQEAQLIKRVGDSKDAESVPLLAATDQLSNAKVELLKIESQLEATAGDAVGGTTEVSVINSPVITTVKGNLAATNTEIEKLGSDVGANNPKMRALLAARSSLHEQLRAEIRTAREEMMAHRNALQKQIDYLEKAKSVEVHNVIAVQSKREELASLQQEVDFRQQELQRALKSAASAQQQSQLSLSNISTLDMATTPVSPAFPKFILVMVAAVGAGLSLGVIFALLAEAFDRRIRVVPDLEFAGPVPILGTLVNSAPTRRRLFTRAGNRVYERATRLGAYAQPARIRHGS
jgi:succinoglycan biosynthesis transport protein ExoP